MARYLEERRILSFAPPLWYEMLVRGVFVVAGLCLIKGFFPTLGTDWLPFWSINTGGYWMILGLALAGAGLWAYLSNERLVCDLRKGTYLRFEANRILRGSLAELDAIVLITEVNPPSFHGKMIYRLVLHWKNAVHPLLVLETAMFPFVQGMALNSSSAQIAARGNYFAQILGLKFFDNSHFASPNPVPVI
ncbi:MAG: hypothetical protein JST40_02330 [Armatimonadetes bacterium]|nr:hypothetical protein [Armatimonadota bacterium]